jgi:ABC-2 type transport system permease protein
MRRVVAQTRIELILTLRRGESVLLTFAIPVLLLAFFSKVDVLPTGGGRPIDFLFPGVLALAVMSTAMVSLAIATGFERQTGVLKRLGSTPLSRPQLLGAKTIAMVIIEALQIAVLVAEGYALGFHFGAAKAGVALAGAILGTIAFAGLGLLMAGSLPALTTLAAANGLYLILLLIGGMVIPLTKLPAGMRTVARWLPSGALSNLLHDGLHGAGTSGQAWVALALWAVVAPVAAAATFRWE